MNTQTLSKSAYRTELKISVHLLFCYNESMDQETLYRMQAKLEGISIQDGYAERVREMPGESGPPPQVQIIRYRSGYEVIFRRGIDGIVQNDIREQRTLEIEDLKELISRRFSVSAKHITHYLTYTTERTLEHIGGVEVELLSSSDVKLNGFGNSFYGSPYRDVFIVQKADAVAAAAHSAREDDQSAELWVYTAPPYRRMAYGKAVASAWINRVLRNRKVPFFSHLDSNYASAGLAKSLELVKQFEVFAFA